MTGSSTTPVPGAPDLVRTWPAARGRTAADRVTELLVAVQGDGVRRDPLGVHHQRVLDLHRRVVARPLDAVVDCERCGTENEFAVPVAAICAVPPPAPDAAVPLPVGDAVVRYRLPTLADLHAVAGAAYGEGMAALAALACLDGTAPACSAADLDRLARAWDKLDPAAAVQVDLVCAGCGDDITADVAVAEFVARDLDRVVDALLRQVDVLARAYGWSEDAILALPAARRLRYVELIGSTRPPAAVGP
jgi:hypothetical protein